MKPIVDVRHLAIRPEDMDGAPPTIVGTEKEGVVIVLKAASRSMIAASKRLPVGTVPEKLHVFVRDPIDRLRSVYQFFTDVQERQQLLKEHLPPRPQRQIELSSWEAFVDALLDGALNPHWEPVADILDKIGSQVLVHRFENLADEFPLGELEKRNVSKRKQLDTTYREDELRAYYARDFAMRGDG